jgi:glycosyltransferase involved in cell wall biosynthesis
VNVCLVSEEFPPDSGCGGIGTYSRLLAGGLVRLGHRVDVVARSWEGDRTDHEDGVTIHRLSVAPPSWRRGTATVATRLPELRDIALWNLRVAARLRRIGRSHGIDVVEAPEYHAQAVLASATCRAPLVVKLHTPAYLASRVNGGRVGGSGLDARLSEGLEQRLARRARLVTAPSRRLADDVTRDWRLPPPVRIVPNPVDDELFAPTGEPRRGAEILYVGRLERRKGVDTLLDALAQIPGARLRLVGQDQPHGAESMGAHLRARMARLGLGADRVEFAGALPREDLPAAYRRAAVCVVPSRYENLPYTCLEAMACGTPVVASAAGGIPEIVTDGADGLLVAPEDPAALAAAVRRVLGDQQLGARLGDAARGTVLERFSTAGACRRTVAAYEEARG